MFICDVFGLFYRCKLDVLCVCCKVLCNMRSDWCNTIKYDYQMLHKTVNDNAPFLQNLTSRD